MLAIVLVMLAGSSIAYSTYVMVREDAKLEHHIRSTGTHVGDNSAQIGALLRRACEHEREDRTIDRAIISALHLNIRAPALPDCGRTVGSEGGPP